MTALVLLASHRDLQSTRIEVSGSPLMGQVLAMAAQTQKYRGLVNVSLTGDATATAALVPTRNALKAATGALQSTLLQHPELDLGSSWQPILEVLDRVAESNGPADAAQSFRLHIEQVEALRRFLSRSAEASGLLLDPEAAPFHLMHLVVEPLSVWTEAVGPLRGREAALLRKGGKGPADHAEMVAQVRMLTQATATAEVIVAALVRSDEPAPAGFTEALAASREFAKRTGETFGSASPSGDAGAYFQAGSGVIALAIDVGSKTSARPQALLAERAVRLHRQWLVQLSVCVAPTGCRRSRSRSTA